MNVYGPIKILLEKLDAHCPKEEISMTTRKWLPLFWLLTIAFVGPAQAQWRADTGLVLVGKVVTMNDAGDILPNARVWVANGKIMAIAKAGDSLPDAAKDAVVIETRGAIYPGMIDLHNHPDYGIYPLMPIKRKYRSEEHTSELQSR